MPKYLALFKTETKGDDPNVIEVEVAFAAVMNWFSRERRSMISY